MGFSSVNLSNWVLTPTLRILRQCLPIRLFPATGDFIDPCHVSVTRFSDRRARRYTSSRTILFLPLSFPNLFLNHFLLYYALSEMWGKALYILLSMQWTMDWYRGDCITMFSAPLLIISNIWFAFLRRGEHWADVFTEILIRNQRSHLWAESQLTVHHCIYDLFPVSITLYLAESEVHYLTFYLPFYYLVTQSCKVFLQLFTVSPLTSSQFVL